MMDYISYTDTASRSILLNYTGNRQNLQSSAWEKIGLAQAVMRELRALNSSQMSLQSQVAWQKIINSKILQRDLFSLHCYANVQFDTVWLLGDSKP